MARSYPYGKVPASIATVVSERFESPMVCCGYCSGHMAARTARGGLSKNGKTEGHQIRAQGGRPHWYGSNAREIRAGLDKALNVNVDGITKDEVLSRVKQGFAVIVSLQYAKLPGYLKVQTNDFGHSSMLRGHRVEAGINYVGYFDPLYAQDSQGSWAKWTDVKTALWDAGHNTTTKKYVPPVPPTPTPTPPTTATEEDIVTTPLVPKLVTVPTNTWLYVWPDFRADPKNVQINPGRDMPLAGGTKAGDYAVGYKPSSNPPANLTVMYAKKGEVTTKNYPPTPSGPTPDQALAIRKAEYTRVVSGSIIQPPKAPE